MDPRIDKMMAARRRELRTLPARDYPAYTGQSTREYVWEFERRNRFDKQAYPFTLEDLEQPREDTIEDRVAKAAALSDHRAPRRRRDRETT